jgi:hypothetical protein
MCEEGFTISDFFLEELRKTMKYVSQNSQSPGPVLNSGTFE